ncbi:MAG: LamG-like jellyroll fold domain-containing protein [Planctomycetota bacterium]|jgi:hypothetical protein
MCKKSICLVPIVLVLGLFGEASAELIAHWRLDADASDVVGGHDGTLLGGAQFVADPERARVLSVDGVSGRVEIPHSDDLVFGPSDSFSIAVWLNIRTLPGSWAGVVNKSRDMSPWYGLWVTPGNQWHFVGGEGGTNTRMDVGAASTGWLHFAGVYNADAQTQTVYVDGEIVDDNTGVTITTTGAGDVWFGGAKSVTEYLDALIDDVRIYNHALTQEELQSVMLSGGEGYPFASGPDPQDGALHADTWANLSWRPGDFAVSHDVYLSDNFDAVNDGAAEAFRGSQTDTFLVAGFPGFPYPDGLAPGATYYWRIDEVNDSEPNSPWKGNVWSFWIPPKTAYDAVPADGSQFVQPDVTLEWTSGFGAKLHTVYFGESFDDVNNATAGAAQTTTSFAPGALELDKTYYWRVDEFDPPFIHKGDVWSFTTTLPGLGKAVAERWENIQTTDINTLKTNPRFPNNPDAIEEVTEFAWDGPDLDDYGGRITAWLHVPSTGDYTFWLNSDDQGELWLSTDDDPGNARLIAQESSWSGLNSWGTGEERSDPIPLVGGEKYYIEALWKEGGGGDHCQVAWQGPGIQQRTVIAGANLSPFEPMSAYGAKPSNRATGVTLMPILTWKAGLGAASHEVYFGTDEQAVANATKTSPEYKGSRQFGSESLDAGRLSWDRTYYWRVDEVNNTNPDSPWAGAVWSFATGDFLVVDDFESYDDIDPAPGEPGLNRIFDEWIDGFGTLTNGALVGNDLPPYAERTIVHSGAQSMNYAYDNAGKTSEATLTLVWPRDWTEEGVTKLSLWMNGSATNAADRIYVALNPGAPGPVYHDDPAATQLTGWNEWIIDLAEFGVNLTNVDSITIGIGTQNAPAATGGTGVMYFDDIRLYR